MYKRLFMRVSFFVVFYVLYVVLFAAKNRSNLYVPFQLESSKRSIEAWNLWNSNVLMSPMDASTTSRIGSRMRVLNLVSLPLDNTNTILNVKNNSPLYVTKPAGFRGTTGFSIDKPYFMASTFQRYKDSILWDYSGCRKGEAYTTDHTFPYDSSTIDISLISSGSINRMFMMPITLSRWSGKTIFVVHMKEEEEATYAEFIRRPENSQLCSPRVTLMAYISKNGSYFYNNYPINILRNVGIRHTRTSHFINLDTDMWISEGSYEVLMKLHDELLKPRVAFVIPAFFSINWKLPDLPLEQQILSIKDKIPRTLDDIKACLKNRTCLERKNELFTHYYTSYRWINDLNNNSMKPYYTYKCWPNRYQEPYLLVGRNDSVVLFNEKLVNYGHNKITYIENLRFHEYTFILAGKVYAFDVPHSPSKYQAQHLKIKLSENWWSKVYYLDHLYKESLNRTNVMTLCSNLNPY